jgi:glycosyltransferase involved in cell wall biosynthesis
MTGAPRVSVVIPAYHSDGVIADCLRALEAQTFPDFETIVVNSSPGDRTRAIVTGEFEKAAFHEVQRRLLPHAARNVGVEAARGDLLAFTDPDCRPRPDWLTRLVAAQETGHRVVCGSIELAGGGWRGRGTHLCKYSFRLSGLPGGPCSIAGTANACVSREVWDAVGPFEGQRFSGDGLLSWRAAARGWQPWFEPGAVVEHHTEGSVKDLWRERRVRGRDFAEGRVEFERWSRARAAAYLSVLPLLPLVVLFRGGVDAVRSGWALTWLLTVPVQFAGHLGWCLGEAGVHRRHALG